MAQWPEPENKKIPEGHYEFRLNREPEIMKFTYHDKNGNEKESRKLKLYAVGLNSTGSYAIIDNFLPWEERYADLCKALDVEHGKDIQMQGGVFEADIKHEPDKKDPTKSWPRIVNIIVPADEAEKPGDDIPF